jgi:hypothetical protein
MHYGGLHLFSLYTFRGGSIHLFYISNIMPIALFFTSFSLFNDIMRFL